MLTNNLPDMTFVKARFRCNKEEKQTLPNSRCLVGISVGRAYQEGEKFLATMDLINETFGSCTIIVADTLQRHNLRLKGLSAQEAYKKSSMLGDEWLERNRLAYSGLSIPVEMYRWDYWLNHCGYQYYRNKLDEMYLNDDEFNASVNDTIMNFVKRRHSSFGDVVAFEHCAEYLLEECALFVLFAETGCEFFVYPSERTDAMRATHDYFLGKTNPDLLREVALRFDVRAIPKKLSLNCRGVDSTPVVLH